MSSSWAAFLPENIAKHPADFVGPNVIGTIVQAFETGVLVNQSLRFWSRASEERLSTKLLVAFVSLAAWFVLCLTLFLSFPSSSHYYKVSDCNRSVQHLAYNRIGIWKLGQSLFFFPPPLAFWLNIGYSLQSWRSCFYNGPIEYNLHWYVRWCRFIMETRS